MTRLVWCIWLLGILLSGCSRTVLGSSGFIDGPEIWGDCVAPADGGIAAQGRPSFSQRAVILDDGEAYFVVANVGAGNLVLNAALEPADQLALWWSTAEFGAREMLDRPLCVPPGAEGWIWVTGTAGGTLTVSFEDTQPSRIEVSVFIETEGPEIIGGDQARRQR